MFSHFDSYIAVFLTGFVVTYLLTPLVRELAVRHGVVDKPGERRPHKHTTARGGGVAVVLGVHAACLVAVAFPWPELQTAIDIQWWRHFVAASVVLLIVGVIDDIRGMRPLVKLAGQTLAAWLIAHSGAKFGSVFGITFPWYVDYFLVMFWIVAVINAFNLIDGLDGLASGLALISATGLCGVFVLGHQPGHILLLLGLMGACLAFLRYNFHPATIFLGDTGSMFLGLTLGAVSLQTFNKNAFLLSFISPLLVLGIPIYDALLAIWRRSIRMYLPSRNLDGTPKKSGIMQPDVEHLHHRLLSAGLSTRRVATLLFIVNLGLVVFGLLMTTFQDRGAGIFLMALLAGVYVLMRQLAVIELRDTGKVLLTGLRRPTHSTLKTLGYPVWDLLCMAGSLAVVMWVFETVREDFWHTWFMDLPLWVTPTFTLFAASRIYVTVWTRARVLDVLVLIFTLQLGLFISLGLALLIDPGDAAKWVARALVIGGLSHPAIVGIRVVYRCVEELLSAFTPEIAPGRPDERVLLYGAGGRCQLFLKERGLHYSANFNDSVIVGLIDDEPSLLLQWVSGHKVLGAGNDLPQLIARHRITGIMITGALRPEARQALHETVRANKLNLSEWSFESRKLCENYS